ncbi:hypothetical protein V502_01778 [Pseudogymnoascus sp. VKM F-4520 (FW-2644)]|nr:hypothetical protein V502_01778 [Pseudogymnoascus sp. VKM F-4520 (FW-2644)]
MIKRWDPISDIHDDISDGSDKWDGRPHNFDKVRTLAINRETLIETHDDYECVFRHFFSAYGYFVDNVFKEYEDDWGDYPPRRYFTEKSTGPLTVVSEKNRCYEEYVSTDIKKRFEREEQDYKKYTAPVLRVMGCRLAPGVNIPVCGSYPQLQDDLQDVFPDIFELGSNKWFLPTKDGNFLKIKMNYDDPTIKISDLATQTAAPRALIAFMDQCYNIRSRWRSNTCGEVASMGQFSKITIEQLSTFTMEQTSDKKNPAIKDTNFDDTRRC